MTDKAPDSGTLSTAMSKDGKSALKPEKADKPDTPKPENKAPADQDLERRGDAKRGEA